MKMLSQEASILIRKCEFWDLRVLVDLERFVYGIIHFWKKRQRIALGERSASYSVTRVDVDLEGVDRNYVMPAYYGIISQSLHL